MDLQVLASLPCSSVAACPPRAFEELSPVLAAPTLSRRVVVVQYPRSGEVAVQETVILVVEDDAALRSVIVRSLADDGWNPIEVASAAAALRMADARPVAAILIDIGLPDADGRDLCLGLRSRGIEAPVLFLTARDAVVDRISGLDAGGDDYITKPFHVDELLARLRAQVRRKRPNGSTLGRLALDPGKHAVVGPDGARARLTPTEFRLLATLLARRGEVVERRSLIRAAWPNGAIVNQNTLDVYIARLRRKLTEAEPEARIETVHGIGYALE